MRATLGEAIAALARLRDEHATFATANATTLALLRGRDCEAALAPLDAAAAVDTVATPVRSTSTATTPTTTTTPTSSSALRDAARLLLAVRPAAARKGSTPAPLAAADQALVARCAAADTRYANALGAAANDVRLTRDARVK